MAAAGTRSITGISRVAAVTILLTGVRVDAQVYFKVKEDEESVKSSRYNVNSYQFQIVNVIGEIAGFLPMTK